MQMEFDVFKLWLTLANLGAAHNINYARGDAPGVGKIANLDSEVSTLQQNSAKMDCSGFITYVLYQTTLRIFTKLLFTKLFTKQAIY